MIYFRYWKITIYLFDGTTYTLGVDSTVNTDLHCIFKVEKRIDAYQQWAEVTIYNLSAINETNILQNGYQITIEAGYQNAPYGQIFKGFIRQPIRGKENGTDYWLKLLCIDGDDALNLGFCNFIMSNGLTVQKMAQLIARNSTVPFQVNVDSNVNSSQTTQRAKVCFGKPRDLLQGLADTANSSFYVNDGQANIVPLFKPLPTNTAIPYLNAKSGMVGIPTQTDQGVKIKSFIRPDMVLDSWFHLNNQDVVVNELEFGELQMILDLDGDYRIISIVFEGDTRGVPWYSEIEAITQSGAVPQLLSDSGASGY